MTQQLDPTGASLPAFQRLDQNVNAELNRRSQERMASAQNQVAVRGQNVQAGSFDRLNQSRERMHAQDMQLKEQIARMAAEERAEQFRYAQEMAAKDEARRDDIVARMAAAQESLVELQMKYTAMQAHNAHTAKEREQMASRINDLVAEIQAEGSIVNELVGEHFTPIFFGKMMSGKDAQFEGIDTTRTHTGAWLGFGPLTTAGQVARTGSLADMAADAYLQGVDIKAPTRWEGKRGEARDHLRGLYFAVAEGSRLGNMQAALPPEVQEAAGVGTILEMINKETAALKKLGMTEREIQAYLKAPEATLRATIGQGGDPEDRYAGASDRMYEDIARTMLGPSPDEKQVKRYVKDLKRGNAEYDMMGLFSMADGVAAMADQLYSVLSEKQLAAMQGYLVQGADDLPWAIAQDEGAPQFAGKQLEQAKARFAKMREKLPEQMPFPENAQAELELLQQLEEVKSQIGMIGAEAGM